MVAIDQAAIRETLPYLTPKERAEIDALIASIEVDRISPPDRWDRWLRTLFPRSVAAPFAPRHADLWFWLWSLQRGVRPRPFYAAWPRGGAKSTNAELGSIRIGAEKIRDYAWYCCETQDQADQHLETIRELTEGSEIERYYPDFARPKVGKFGNIRGWRRNRLWAANGFVIDAIGLDTARRGARVTEARPGLMVFDDLDGKYDSPATTAKKIGTLTHSLLPAGSNDLAVLFVQNLIHPNSIASQLAEGTADFLTDCQVSGPFRAIDDFSYEPGIDPETGRQIAVITGGRPTWEGQDLEVCQNYIKTFGITSFNQECQQEVDAPPGGIWDHIEFQHIDRDQVPDLIRGCVWVDPAVTDTDQSDSHGIQADGLGIDKIIYRFYSWEQRTSPEDAIKRAILKCIELGFDTVGIETDQGGDTWETVYKSVWADLVKSKDHPQITRRTRRPRFKSDKAGAGHGSKVHRNGLMLADYEGGRVVHVRGTCQVLEKALKRFPLTKPLDLADAAYWSWADLRRKLSNEPERKAPGILRQGKAKGWGVKP